MSGMNPHFHAVIPAGGSGTRLWPISRSDSPKFLHDILGTGRTLLQSTWDRLEPLAVPERTWIVTGAAHAAAVQEQLPDLLAQRVITEPSPRDSAAAIGLAAFLIYRQDPQAIMGSFSADHSITNPEEFQIVIRQAIAAADTGSIVTVGITPTYASTAYGYIKTGELLDLPGAPSARQVLEFVEKPAAATARRYTFSGRYRWNAGMFIARAEVLLNQFAVHAPALFSKLEEIAQAHGTDREAEVYERVWPTLEKIAIDYVIAEPAAKAGTVIVVPGDFGWDDVGDFDSVAKLRQPARGESQSVQVIGDVEVISVDSSGIVLGSGEKVTALVGLEDVVVVDTADALLVTTRAHAQDVKKVVEELKTRGLTSTL